MNLMRKSYLIVVLCASSFATEAQNLEEPTVIVGEPRCADVNDLSCIEGRDQQRNFSERNIQADPAVTRRSIRSYRSDMNDSTEVQGVARAPQSCASPDGSIIQNQDSKTFYFSSQSDNCNGSTELRTCYDGQLSGSASFTSCEDSFVSSSAILGMRIMCNGNSECGNGSERPIVELDVGDSDLVLEGRGDCPYLVEVGPGQSSGAYYPRVLSCYRSTPQSIQSYGQGEVVCAAALRLSNNGRSFGPPVWHPSGYELDLNNLCEKRPAGSLYESQTYCPNGTNEELTRASGWVLCRKK